MTIIDYDSIVYGGAEVLQLVPGGDRRKYDNFLMVMAPIIREKIEKLLEEVIDDINSEVSSQFVVRIVHEDTEDFVEVLSHKEE